MTASPKSISELIALWPTIGAYAADVGCGYEAARKMRDRESIAPEHWRAVVAACERKGITDVTLDWLAELAEQRATEAVQP